jgi:hypothetical protein
MLEAVYPGIGNKSLNSALVIHLPAQGRSFLRKFTKQIKSVSVSNVALLLSRQNKIQI